MHDSVSTPTYKERLRSLLPAGALGLSLLVHAIALLLVGGLVLVEGVIPKQAFQDMGETMAVEDALVIPETPPDEVMDKPVLEQLHDASQPSAFGSDSPASADIIIADSPNGSMSLLPVMATAASPVGTSLGGIAGPQGSSRSTGPSGRRLVNLFGNTMESSNLGVILDVSGSAHPLLLPVMKEIDKNYGNARTVLAFGCGMSKAATRKAANITVELYKSAPDPASISPSGTTTLGQIASAMKKSSDLAKYLEKLRSRDDVWYVKGGSKYATRDAFEKLMAEKVDTIFWFADFQDPIDELEAAELVKDLKREGITVVMYDFTGKATAPAKTVIATNSGGKVISQVIK